MAHPLSEDDQFNRDSRESLPSALTCPILIGRVREVLQLDQALRAARAGLGHSVLIAGEAGVGKSRLLAEMASRAANGRFTILTGHCFEQDASFPYAPWIDLLRA